MTTGTSYNSALCTLSLDCVSTLQGCNSNIQLFSNQKSFSEESRNKNLKVNLKYNVQHPCKRFQS